MKTHYLSPKTVALILCVCIFMQYNTNAQSGNLLYGVTTSSNELVGTIFHIDPKTGIQTIDHALEHTGYHPRADLTEGGNGKFYGMTPEGGEKGGGVIFEWDPSTNIYIEKIDLDSALGCIPYGSLTFHDNKFYAVTTSGGLYNKGVIFEWDPVTNIYTKKIDFDDTIKGSNPEGTLTFNGGKFYGMTKAGGANDLGVIFEWDPVTNIYIKKIDFDGSLKGSSPHGALTFKKGKFYGMTEKGGANEDGVIFEWDPGTNTFVKKIDFDGTTKGSNPFGSLTLCGENFFGLTLAGGTNNVGVIFEWNSNDNSFFKKLDLGTGSEENPRTGYSPYGSLILNDGKLYGMNSTGGASDNGDIFEWDPATDRYTYLTDFSFLYPSWENTRHPFGSLTIKDGKFYGMVYSGGISGNGVIFKWDPSEYNLIKEYDFNTIARGYLFGSLVQSNGKFYGLNIKGQSRYPVYSIFEWDPATNTYVQRTDISIPHIDGGPQGSLNYSDGYFYATVGYQGYVMKWDPITKIVKFTGNLAESLTPALGKFYGMYSTFIFEWDPIDNVFTNKIDLDCSINGCGPSGPLTFNGGKFYGITNSGGVNDAGVIFEWDPSTNNFVKKIDLERANGSHSEGSLTLCGGKFYGMTSKGGSEDMGVIFEWDTTTNILTKKIDFDGTAKGRNPTGSLTLSNGKFYGMTDFGGTNDMGVIFEWDPITNAYTKLLDFNGANGRNPVHSRFTTYIVDVPALQASNLSFSEVQNNQLTINWTNGNGIKRAVFVKEGTGPISDPTSYTTYTASADWSTKGSQLGASGYYCVYNGTDNSIILKGLTKNTTYTVQVFEYNGIPGAEIYNTTTSSDNPKTVQTTNSAPFTIAGTETICQGEPITIPLTVNNFTNVSAISLSLEYNPQLMTFSSGSNINSIFIGALIDDVTVSVTLHKINFVWSDVYPITLPDGAKLVDLNFTHLSGSPTLVFDNIENSGRNSEYAGENGDPFNDNPTASYYTNGQVILTGLPVSVEIVADNNTVCSGTPVTYNATPTNGGTTPSYQWKVNQENAGINSSTFYYIPANGDVITCEITSNLSCIIGNPATSNSITMIVNPLPSAPSASVTDLPSELVPTGTITVSDPIPAPGIFFSIDGVTYDNSTGIFVGVIPGTYNVTVKDGSDCISLATSLVVNPYSATGITENVSSAYNVKAYPNPFTEKLHFEFINETDSHAKLEIFNIVGAKLETLFDENILRGKLNKVEFMPKYILISSQVIIYHLTMGEKTYVGKLTFQDSR